MTKLTEREGVRAGLSEASARFLETACFYWPKVFVQRDGKYWLVFSAEQWREKLCLSDWRFRQALAELKERGVFVVSKHRWKGHATNYISLDFNAVESLRRQANNPLVCRKSPPSSLVVKPPSSSETNELIVCRKPTNYYNLVERKKSKRKKVSKGSSLRSENLQAQNDNHKKVEEKEEGEITKQVAACPTGSLETRGISGKLETVEMDVQQVKAKMESAISTRMAVAKAPTPEGGSKVSVLHADWRLLVGSPENIISPKISGSDIGCLKRLIAVSPEGQARAVLASVANSWREFTDMLEVQHGAYKMPRTPALWVISKFADATVTFWSQQKAAVAKAAEKQAAVQLISKLPPKKTLDPAQLAAWVKEEFDALYLEKAGPRKPGDEARHANAWYRMELTLTKNIQRDWSIYNGQGLVYPGPRVIAAELYVKEQAEWAKQIAEEQAQKSKAG